MQNDFFIPSSPVLETGAQNPYRLGVYPVENGVDVAVVAPHAQAVEVCFFNSGDPTATEYRYQLRGPVDGIWHGHVFSVTPGTFYGFRAWGEWAPEQGLFYNPYKLLLDPYAKAIHGQVELCSQTHAHRCDSDLYPLEPMQLDPTNSAPYTVRGVVSGPSFPLTPGPRIPWNETVIYEAHVRGFTMSLPGIPEHLRGTYAGLAHPASINYLKNLGVTTLELLPIHAKSSEAFLAERGLTNYWGYSTLSYFAPEPSYATAQARSIGPLAVLDEVRGMVSLLHQAGIEVILDVVYNHTCEGSRSGQTLSWRGLDNSMYYRLEPDNAQVNRDFTGCGNTLDMSHPRVRQMVLDSMRYWAGEVGVDGFRFDLAVSLGRMRDDFTQDHPFFQACLDDPILASKKMIAEPWDIGPNGWRTSDFPLPFSSWNDRYRDSMRSFWLDDARSQSRGESRGKGAYELASRLSGSQDLFGHGDLIAPRTPRCSVNFITAHDGFTLADLTCYDHKHNEANLEDNRDGNNHNLSWNHGAEGRAYGSEKDGDILPASIGFLQDLQIMRGRSIRNLFTSLLVSSGTPMLVAGDEFGRSQYGNNNAYCQDNEISWLDWDWHDWQKELHECVCYLLELRRKYQVFRPDKYLSGQSIGEDVLPDLSWYDRNGLPMEDRSWHDPYSRLFQMLRSGKPYHEPDLLMVCNGILEDIEVKLAPGRGNKYRLVWDSAWLTPDRENMLMYQGGDKVNLSELSIQIYLTD